MHNLRGITGVRSICDLVHLSVRSQYLYLKHKFANSSKRLQISKCSITLATYVSHVTQFIQVAFLTRHLM